MIGFFGYLAASLILETRIVPTEPSLSYGQMAMLIPLPICTIIGVSGFATPLAAVRWHLTSITLLLLVWFWAFGTINTMWNDQIAVYGSDPSEAVLFYPPLAFANSALVAAVIVAIVAVVRWLPKRT